MTHMTNVTGYQFFHLLYLLSGTVTNKISFKGQTNQNQILASLPPVGHTKGVSRNESVHKRTQRFTNQRFKYLLILELSYHNTYLLIKWVCRRASQITRSREIYIYCECNFPSKSSYCRRFEVLFSVLRNFRYFGDLRIF